MITFFLILAAVALVHGYIAASRKPDAQEILPVKTAAQERAAIGTTKSWLNREFTTAPGATFNVQEMMRSAQYSVVNLTEPQRAFILKLKSQVNGHPNTWIPVTTVKSKQDQAPLFCNTMVLNNLCHIGLIEMTTSRVDGLFQVSLAVNIH